ncbi:MBL fold metallo-hydrolase [Cesiribacter andamanensis]|uniref:Metal-dependent hydrolase n=1 Tax=Cesiribacter andamanensis AMV16 TaxID=1279009 RepID=M7N6H3_9BACT|nr:MBL fold metallo-hydrolase [Cesiribacter andamanensis]EMR02816.1 metal-dependent hydrolase [Cesiribacter andamanensis AMV16]
MKFIGKALLSLLIFLAFLAVLTGMVRHLHKPFGRPPQADAYTHLPHYREGKFQNPVETPMLKVTESWPVMKRYLSRDVEKAPAPSYHFREQMLSGGDTSLLQLNWLGHAAVLIRKGDSYLLTDPVLTERASPFAFAGPKRYFSSPIAPADLPPIDAVIISHDHYDHLDYGTIIAIHQKVKQFIVPLGVGATLRYWGVPAEKISELDWWQPFELREFRITAAPARHFSGRFLSQNNTFWASYGIEFGGQKIYFGGDSGYFGGYEEIGEKLGPFDVSLMPIGAYDVAWANIHLNPQEAVQAHLEVQGGLFFPTHWGTFDLALHSWYEPMELLLQEADRAGISLLTPAPGQWISPASRTDPQWWAAHRARN